MKTLFAVLIIITLAFTPLVRADVANDLADLKSKFPEWTPPSSLAKYKADDPLVKDCVAKYRGAVNHMSDATYVRDVKILREQLAADIAKYAEIVKSSEKSHATGSQFFAAKANALWLKGKVAPFLEKIAAVK